MLGMHFLLVTHIMSFQLIFPVIWELYIRYEIPINGVFLKVKDLIYIRQGFSTSNYSTHMGSFDLVIVYKKDDYIKNIRLKYYNKGFLKYEYVKENEIKIF